MLKPPRPSRRPSRPPPSSTFIQGTLTSVPGTSFLIQFFSNAMADPSGFGQGQTLIGAATVVTNTSGSTSFSLTIPIVVPSGLLVTATATNLSTGDTSEFSQDLSAVPVSVEFVMAQYTVESTAGTAAIAVERIGNSNATVSVNYATSNGTAIAGRDYMAASGT